LQDKIETWLAWRRVEHEILSGTLGGEFEKSERANVAGEVRDAEEAVQDEVWATYRYIVLWDQKEPDGLRVIDLGAGHATSGETLSGRVITTLKSQGLLNESVGAGYVERNWPPALKESGAWPLAGLRQSFLNGALIRLLDPDTTLRTKLPEFVEKGEFGLASGQQPDGTFERVWWKEPVSPDEITFDTDVFLLIKARAKALKVRPEPPVDEPEPPEEEGLPQPIVGPPAPEPDVTPVVTQRTVRVSGTIPPEVWNRLGTKLIPKLRSGSDLRLGINAEVRLDAAAAASLKKDLELALSGLGLSDLVDVDIEE
jgi:hypothetical protein